MKEKTLRKAKEACEKVIRDANNNKEMSFTKVFTLRQNRFEMSIIARALEMLQQEGKIESRMTQTSSDKDHKDTWFRWV